MLEYTIFSKQPEELTLYENKLELYRYNRYGIKQINYAIDRVEFGKIPMNDAVHHPWYAPRVLNLGFRPGLQNRVQGIRSGVFKIIRETL
ncbi:MAG: hypothetical protein U5K69_18075 [Balneolaceae bacterium]|nr:hypothetical protein [Balneolaceae bacterium]